MNSSNKKKLVIIGGGFGGLNLARKVDKKLWDVVVVDRNNYHSFPPLFYQVASSGIEPSNISFPLRRELHSRHYRGCSYHFGKVYEIDTEAQTVRTDYETIHYDSLVIAAGTTNNFFGITDLEKYVYTIKSTSEAIRTRNEILDRLERASISTNPEERRRMLTFVVVGGGPSGVEIAGALGELKRYILKREYPAINPDEMHVILVEGGQALLPAMGLKSSTDALKGLRQLMVDVKLGKIMKGYANRRVSFADGTTIDTDTVIWTAGVTGNSFELKGTDVGPGRGGRFEVDEYNKVKGLDNVYAIGDIALMVTDDYPHGHPQVAQGAIQQGRNLGHNLNVEPARRKPFRYHDKGSMATIGRDRAVVDIGKMHMSGRMAWWAWLVVHLMTLLGMRNRAVVFINWIWNYINFSAGLRLLIRPEKYPLRQHWQEQ